MKSHFDSDFFRNNRQALLSLLKDDSLVIIAAHGLMQRNSDTTFPFRQDSNFWYLTGIDEPDIILVIDKGEEYLIVPYRETTREAFDGSIDTAYLQRRSAIGEVIDEKKGWERLKARLKNTRKVATLAPPSSYVEALGIYTNPARQRLVSKLEEYNSNLEFTDIRDALVKLRAVKQAPEIAAINAAIDITVDTILELQRNSFTNYPTEYVLEAAITAGFRSKLAGHGYTPIVAGGKNACTLHYIQNNSELHEGELLLLDVGAEVENYSADITRTYAYGKATERQTVVHKAVTDAQEYAFGQLKPGVKIREYEKLMESFMGEKLRELGLIDAADHDAVRAYYPHATSHFLGLDVHDVGGYESPLKPGMVLTVEPGIYVPEEGIGIRIEDDVLITEDGIEVLTARLPKSLS